ncbi:MAG: pitrilysin family protein [Crocinitomicaceae bacterium]
MKRILTSLFVAGSLLVANAQDKPKKVEFVEYDLPNGLHVILHQNNTNPLIAVSVLYHVGSKDEDTNRTGFAHFFEHLLFEGSTNIGRGEYSELVEDAGGSLNANTSQDRTFYFELLPSNELELGLWLESERMLHAKVDQLGVETQREVVKEEKRQRIDNQPYGTFLTNAFDLAFDVHPYRWMPIGSMEHLDAATEEDYIKFYRTFYVPNNATLSIAGDINIEETKKLVKKYFSGIPTGEKLNVYRDVEFLNPDDFVAKYFPGAPDSKKEKIQKDLGAKTTEEILKMYFSNVSSKIIPIPRPTAVEPALGGEKRMIVEDNVQLPAVLLGYRMPEQNSSDFYAVQILNRILSGSKSARFNKTLVEKDQKALFVQGFPLPMEHPGLALVLGISNMGVSAEDLEKSMDEQIDKLLAEGVTEEEMEIVKNKIETDFYSTNSKVSGISENLANFHVYFGSADQINKQMEKYLSVSKEDILRVAKKYYVKDNRIVLHYVPKSEQ